MTEPTVADNATQKPSKVAVAVAAAEVLVEPNALSVPDAAQAAPPVSALTADTSQSAELIELLTEALTALSIYAEVAPSVVSYRGEPFRPYGLIDRIQRVIGA
jgi:hypothetical protein